MENLTLEEQKIFLIVRRRRVEYWRRVKSSKPLGNASKHGLLLAICAAGLMAFSPAEAIAAPAAVSASALYNAANADQRAGRLGPAVLDYERANLLAPHDEAIVQNLRVAQQKAGLAASAFPAWEKPAHWLTFNELAGLASICLLLFSLLFFGTRLIPVTLRGLARATASSLGIVAVLAAAAVALRWPELDRAVIVGDRAVAYIAPTENAAASCELRPGQIVQAEGAYGAFVRVRTDDGRCGWVASPAVEKIIPTAS